MFSVNVSIINMLELFVIWRRSQLLNSEVAVQEMNLILASEMPDKK